MKYYKEVILKNNNPCILRNPTATDSEKLIEHIKITSDETNFLIRYSDEFSMTVEQETDFLLKTEENPRAVMVVAIVNGEIAGSAGMSVAEPFLRCAHRASFGISIKEKYWGLGIGSLLTDSIIQCSKIAGFEYLELEVVAHNKRALTLYEKKGFRTYGMREKSFLYRDKTYADMLLMTMKL